MGFQAADDGRDGGQVAVEFSRQLERWQAGELAPEAFTRYRTHRGVYSMRGQPGAAMVRIKVPGGLLTAAQLDGLARLAAGHAGGRGHFTTRQDLQLYGVPLGSVPELLAALGEVGLTTREAGGNSVRNVTACPLAGLCADEVCDVRPYAAAVTAHFLGNPVSQNLPRKFKVAFSGCGRDCAVAGIQDVGCVAAWETDGGQRRRGFRIYLGGGLGATPRAAFLLEPWTPAFCLLDTLEAAVRVFDRHGNREHKQRARLKFVVEQLGVEAVRQLVLSERQVLIALRPYGDLAGPRPEAGAPGAPAVPAPGDGGLAGGGDAPGYALWHEHNVVAERQPGQCAVAVHLPAGDATTAQMAALAEVARVAGDGTVRVSLEHSLYLPGVAAARLGLAHALLRRAGLAEPGARGVRCLVGCPGAGTCNLAITHSHRLAEEILRRLQGRDDLALDPALQGVRIKVSGCPNACGHHHVADIGLHGASRVVRGHWAPCYQVLLGGQAREGDMRFGRPLLRVPARKAPDLVLRLLQRFQAERRPGEDFAAWVDRLGREG